jgi:hypothetical protein
MPIDVPGSAELNGVGVADRAKGSLPEGLPGPGVACHRTGSLARAARSA